MSTNNRMINDYLGTQLLEVESEPLDTKESIYLLHFNEDTAILKTKELLNPKEFQREIFEATGNVIRLLSKSAHDEFIQKILGDLK